MMTKKLFLVLVLAALVAGGAFAQFTLSGGGGIYMLSSFGGGSEFKYPADSLGIVHPAFTASSNMSITGIGAFGFFDATYIEASVGFLYGITGSIKNSSSPTVTAYDDFFLDSKVSMMGINIGFLGKFPIRVAPNVLVFPAAGIDYQVFLSAKSTIGNIKSDITPASDLNALWIRAGAGLDFYISRSMFIRATALYGIRFASGVDKELVKEHIDDYGNNTAKAKRGNSIVIRAAIGFSF